MKSMIFVIISRVSLQWQKVCVVMKSMIFVIRYVAIILSLCVLPLTGYSLNPIKAQNYESISLKKPLSLKTGLLYLNHYHRQFNQSGYSFDLRGNKKLSSKGSFIFNSLGFLKVQGQGASSYSIPEIYYVNQLSSKLEYSFGRRIVNWSELEKYLPSGFWNNVWDFNKVSPIKEGLVGIFSNYKISNRSNLEFFVSPISVPKTTLHYKFDGNGNVKTNTLWVNQPLEEIEYRGNEYKIKYFLDLNIPELIVHPQIGGSFNWSNEKTFIKASYLYGPSKDVDTAIDVSLNVTTPEVNIDALVLPERVGVHKGTIEFGKYWSENSKTILSTSYRQRTKKLPALIGDTKSYIGTSSGGVYQLSHEQFFKDKSIGARVHVIENTAIENIASGEFSDFLLNSLFIPFQYKRGVGAGIGYKIGSRLKVDFQGYYDIKLEGAMGDFSIDMSWGKTHLALGYNVIEAISSQTKGFYKHFRENDSYYMGVSYVF